MANANAIYKRVIKSMQENPHTLPEGTSIEMARDIMKCNAIIMAGCIIAEAISNTLNDPTLEYSESIAKSQGVKE